MSESNDDVGMFDDIAARAEAYGRLLLQVAEIKDRKLRVEGLSMLSAVRRSIKTLPESTPALVKMSKGA